jgi:hypothetical protein
MACHPDAHSSSIIAIMNYSVNNKYAEFNELAAHHSYYIATSGVEKTNAVCDNITYYSEFK